MQHLKSLMCFLGCDVTKDNGRLRPSISVFYIKSVVKRGVLLVYQKYYDPKKIALRAVILVYNNYPDLDDATKRQMAESEEWLDVARQSFVLDDLTMKIKEHERGVLNYTASSIVAARILNTMPSELLPNIEEWIDDQPISDIKVNGVSVPDIMHQFQERNILFLEAMQCMCDWKNYNFQCTDFCRLYFMRPD